MHATWINMKKKQFVVVKMFKGKGQGKWLGHFWFLNKFLEVAPSNITPWVCPLALLSLVEYDYDLG
jgi:hypothetical protein